MGECIECGSRETEFVRYDDGHFRKECSDCGYVGGPYVSNYSKDDESGQQTSWNDWG